MIRALTASQLTAVVDNVFRVFDLMLKVHDDGKHYGGYYCLADRDGNLLAVIAVGTMTPEKAERYKRLAEEKIQRLAANLFHLSSWQSRREEDDQWGGAIRGIDNLHSFSGSSELGDETISMEVADLRNDLSPVTAELIAKYSNNLFFRPFQEAVKIALANSNQ